MHALPRGHRLDVAGDGAARRGQCRDPRDRHALGRHQAGRGPHHLRARRRRRLADPGPDPPFPARSSSGGSSSGKARRWRRRNDDRPASPSHGSGARRVAQCPASRGTDPCVETPAQMRVDVGASGDRAAQPCVERCDSPRMSDDADGSRDGRTGSRRIRAASARACWHAARGIGGCVQRRMLFRARSDRGAVPRIAIVADRDVRVDAAATAQQRIATAARDWPTLRRDAHLVSDRVADAAMAMSADARTDRRAGAPRRTDSLAIWRWPSPECAANGFDAVEADPCAARCAAGHSYRAAGGSGTPRLRRPAGRTH